MVKSEVLKELCWTVSFVGMLVVLVVSDYLRYV